MFGAWSKLEAAWPGDIAATVQGFAGQAEVAWLDSASAMPDAGNPFARFSLIACEPAAVLEQFERSEARLTIRGRQLASEANGWRLWRDVQRRMPVLAPGTAPIAPGWIGYVGFEMARQLERLPARRREALGLPLLRLGLFDEAIVLDHATRQAFAVRASGVREMLELPHRPLAHLVERWNQAASASLSIGAPPRPHVMRDVLRSEYEARVRRALEYIAAGDIYQVNLAQRLTLDGVGDGLAQYVALRRANPAPFGALLRWDHGAVASVSPELFLRIEGRDVLTCPIKGTRPATGDAILDASYREQLLASEKDAAELTMIVDLHRNDLGRVCEYGSIRVRDPKRIERHPTVFHTVADVVGRLRSDRDALHLLAACFPAGSISGVPKIRAIEIIDELETTGRGVYTGAIGNLALDGRMTFNVAIRTLQFRAARGTLHVGGGIVADSDPAEEYEETLAKARGMLAGLGLQAVSLDGPERVDGPAAGGSRNGEICA